MQQNGKCVCGVYTKNVISEMMLWKEDVFKQRDVMISYYLVCHDAERLRIERIDFEMKTKNKICRARIETRRCIRNSYFRRRIFRSFFAVGPILAHGICTLIFEIVSGWRKFTIESIKLGTKYNFIFEMGKKEHYQFWERFFCVCGLRSTSEQAIKAHTLQSFKIY